MSDKTILYISYDGMTDPLGQSQVLPYIIGLSKEGYSFSLISCEKKERFEKEGKKIGALCEKHGIDWYPLPFTTKPPLISKLLDKRRIKKLAISLYKEKKFSMVHCRSYVAAEIGLMLKKRFGTKFFFDMRGFWVDERVDGGIWNLNNPLYRLAYKAYKRKEGDYIRYADYIVSLTENAVAEIRSWSSYQGAPFTVIPCSADFSHFVIPDQRTKAEAKENLDLSQAAPVISYLGSVGTWYLLDEMLRFFVLIAERYPLAVFLIITAEKPSWILQKAEALAISADRIKIVSASREQVPVFLGASDLSLSFIKTSYSKKASSPTKLGELFAMGIPVVTNGDVGDVEKIVNDLQAGRVLADFSEPEMRLAVDRLEELMTIDPEALRTRAKTYYDLKNAIRKYCDAYEKVLS